MTAASCAPAPAAAWTWPLPLGHYDQTPTLSPDELVVLARLDQCIQQHHCRSQPTLRASLERLTCPLHDALTYLGLHPTHRQTAINALLQQMYRRHTAIWGWTAADWAAVLSTDLQHGCRFAAFASAYLLCGLRDLHLVATHLPSFAYRVFGRDRVDAAIEQLVAPLRTWGYQGRTQELLSGICSILLVNGSPELRDLTSALLERLQYEQVLPRYRWVVGGGLPRLIRAGLSSGTVAGTADARCRRTGAPPPQRSSGGLGCSVSALVRDLDLGTAHAPWGAE